MKPVRFDDVEIREALVFADQKRVLNAGSGRPSGRSLHPVFANAAWREVRMDIDPGTTPDIVGSVTDMRSSISSGSFDAVWSSHSLEHLYTHEVTTALSEFRRILKPDGFALITCPDLEAVALVLLEHGSDHVAYVSAIGPITPLDMLFGHRASIATGNRYMAHKTGFTTARLGRLLVEAGFGTVLVKTEKFDLWILALMPLADRAAIERQLRIVDFNIFGSAV
jgi:predicted SAM-dependent methyltransferase